MKKPITPIADIPNPVTLDAVKNSSFPGLLVILKTLTVSLKNLFKRALNP